MSSGYSRIVPTGVTFKYPVIDLANKRVIAHVLFNDMVKMKVTIDLKSNTVQKEGSIDDFASMTGISRIILNEEQIVESLRSTAAFYIENNISDPAPL
ncbi:hypothetical protein [Paenibacillus sp. YPG26]|uniref:hypothetical protein n=1 Tax=Paenibacillus sp. YPG26 TaxID=2878915 RepID=UPI00203B1939|nr:hypothetical protein [Paenibacillus sp. YPG26]USB33955.1 hypothetical protein LDO05_03800 [Paenibacillus sp. YPG26]